jgi:hypothetical protein
MSLLNEVQAIQNPALGAALIWRFVCGFAPVDAAQGAPLPLAFTVLPLVLHARTAQEIAGTQSGSGLRKFEEKFKDRGDMLLSLQRRVVAMRMLSLRSTRIAVACGLVTLVPADGVLWPLTRTEIADQAKSVDVLLRAADKLGAWCRPLTLFEIAGILRVEF